MSAAARPSRLVLLGHPVAHSVSPVFQNAALRYAGIPLVYEAVDTTPAALDVCLDALIAERAAGNATIPHKERVAARCTLLTPVAERVGAVNTFRVDADGSLVGHNTDVAGFDWLARTALGDAPLPRRVALLGAGGAAAAVLAAVERWPECEVTLFNRSAERRERLAERFAVVLDATGDIARAVKGCEMVVNATPLGLRASDALPVAIDSLERGAVVVDLVYSRDETRWVHAARAAGHRAADGLEMLLEQGALAFEWWLGEPAPREIMRNAVRGTDAAARDRHPREGGDPLSRHLRESGDPCSAGLNMDPRFRGDDGGVAPAATVRRFTRTVGGALLDLLLPRACVACRRLLDTGDEGPVCGRCWARLQALHYPRCDRCGHPMQHEKCTWCELLPPFVRAARSLCWIPGRTGAPIVHALKYGGWSAVAEGMAERMARLSWPRDVIEERTALVPVPLARVRERERGYNQSALLARALATRWDVPVWENVLERVRATRTQTRLTPDQRRGNVSGAFRVPETATELRGKHLVLVDDVVTTGATLAACAAELFGAGARVISIVTFGRAPASGDHV